MNTHLQRSSSQHIPGRINQANRKQKEILSTFTASKLGLLDSRQNVHKKAHCNPCITGLLKEVNNNIKRNNKDSLLNNFEFGKVIFGDLLDSIKLGNKNLSELPARLKSVKRKQENNLPKISRQANKITTTASNIKKNKDHWSKRINMQKIIQKIIRFKRLNVFKIEKNKSLKEINIDDLGTSPFQAQYSCKLFKYLENVFILNGIFTDNLDFCITFNHINYTSRRINNDLLRRSHSAISQNKQFLICHGGSQLDQRKNQFTLSDTFIFDLGMLKRKQRIY